MTLADLAFACFVYERISNFDNSYRLFLNATRPVSDFQIQTHREALLIWLNQWGCRQFALGYHVQASEQILNWHTAFARKLPSVDRNLWELTEDELNSVAESYQNLVDRIASYRQRNGTTFPVNIGPTGAAKILFAIRPKSLMLWDDPIRKRLGYDGSANSYKAYLKHVQIILKELNISCIKQGYQIFDLPELLGRTGFSIPKMIDEYYWVNITNRCQPPTAEILKNGLCGQNRR